MQNKIRLLTIVCLLGCAIAHAWMPEKFCGAGSCFHLDECSGGLNLCGKLEQQALYVLWDLSQPDRKSVV